MKKLILAIAIVVYLGTLHKWYFTLSGDLQNYYYPIAKHIFTTNTLIYPPGANLFFLLLPSLSFTIYQLAFVTANILLILFLARLTKKPGLLSLLVLCAGPIVLFRFDLLVVVLLTISLLAFSKSHYPLSGFFLGLAAITKIFPAILLPYFLLTVPNKRKFLISFTVAVGLVLLIYIGVTGESFLSVVNGLYFNYSKSVHMESVMGSVLTIITAFTNPGPHGVGFFNALWVLDPLYLLGHARIFRFFAPVFLLTIYGLIFLKNRRFNIALCFLLILSLVISSQVFSPQYILWVAFLCPLLNIKRLDLVLILLALVCTQLIYPLNYGELIDFFDRGINPWLFGILVIRNLTLVILAARLIIHEKLLPFLPKE